MLFVCLSVSKPTKNFLSQSSPKTETNGSKYWLIFMDTTKVDKLCSTYPEIKNKITPFHFDKIHWFKKGGRCQFEPTNLDLINTPKISRSTNKIIFFFNFGYFKYIQKTPAFHFYRLSLLDLDKIFLVKDTYL